MTLLERYRNALLDITAGSIHSDPEAQLAEIAIIATDALEGLSPDPGQFAGSRKYIAPAIYFLEFDSVLLAFPSRDIIRDGYVVLRSPDELWAYATQAARDELVRHEARKATEVAATPKFNLDIDIDI